MGARLADRELLRRLVESKATSRRSNLPLVDFVADYLDRPGVRVERIFSANADKANLIVHIGPVSDDREGLVLSGHTDVVPRARAGIRIRSPSSRRPTRSSRGARAT